MTREEISSAVHLDSSGVCARSMTTRSEDIVASVDTSEWSSSVGKGLKDRLAHAQKKDASDEEVERHCECF